MHSLTHSRPCSVGVSMLVAWLFAHVALAQDMRVYTTVSDVGGDSAQPRIVARSRTLFHGDKVYDVMEDVGEVVILDQGRNRFVIMNDGAVAASVEFEELQRLLKVAHTEAERYVQELHGKGDSNSAQHAAAIKFQLHPQFRELTSTDQKNLKLQGDFVSYDVETFEPRSAELAQRYITYADWAARLNSILHPQSTFPGPRLLLNDRLRSRKRLPTRVDLRVKVDGDMHLQASHRFTWELLPEDKRLITTWERSLTSERVRWVSFHEYQENQLVRTAKN